MRGGSGRDALGWGRDSTKDFRISGKITRDFKVYEISVSGG